MTVFMPILKNIEHTFTKHQPLKGLNVLVHMHLTKEVVCLGECLKAGGAKIYYWPSNKNPTKSWILEHIANSDCSLVNSVAELEEYINNTGEQFLVIEGNGRIFSLVNDITQLSPFSKSVIGISEHTSGGGNKIDSFDANKIKIPIVAVYKDPLKHSLETGIGTAQSSVGALIRGIQTAIAGKRILIVGFGRVGSGLCKSLFALGARIYVADQNPEKCIMAKLSGYKVVSLSEGIKKVDICITATGISSVVNANVLDECKNGLILANLSNISNEIDTTECDRIQFKSPECVVWRTKSGRLFEVLCQGIQINHVLGTGNPSGLMDISLSLHALNVNWLYENQRHAGVFAIPEFIRTEIATKFFEYY
jgi:adenosylhomocysteinase